MTFCVRYINVLHIHLVLRAETKFSSSENYNKLQRMICWLHSHFNFITSVAVYSVTIYKILEVPYKWKFYRVKFSVI